MGIIEKDYKEVLKNNMKDYYEEILCHRAIPEVADGLTEVQRRFLYVCYKYGWTSNKQHVKCAKINGTTLSWHPHGDSSVYDALTNTAQWWKQQILYMDTSGSVGSVYGDEPAAPRYLAARTDKTAEKIFFNDMKSDCVDYVDNYDLTEVEPHLLPARLPMYLINGAFGIAGGYAVSVPTHNPLEVIDETIKYIKDSSHKIELLPDFPTGGYIVNNKDVWKGYNEGRGKVIIRAKIVKDEKKHRLIIKEIPYMKTLDFIREKLILCTKETKENGKVTPPVIPAIKNVKDASSNEKIELIIEVKKDADLDHVESLIYKHTPCQTTFSIILLGTKNREFEIYNNLNEIIEEWLSYRRRIVRKVRLGYMKKYKLRVHIIEALQKILKPSIIEEVIKKIRKCKGKKEVTEMLINDYDLSNVQAENIVTLELYKLNSLSLDELIAEKEELLKKIDTEMNILKNKENIDNIILEDLESFRTLFKDKTRKTMILGEEAVGELKDAIVPDTNHSIIVTKKGYIKKLEPMTAQKRNGKGINVGNLKDGDYPVFIEELSNKDNLFIFTKEGKVYKHLVRDLKENNRTTLGNFIGPTINNENIVSCLNIPYGINIEDYQVVISTMYNKIKVVDLSEFSNIGNVGIIASKLNEGDKILNTILINKNNPNDEIAITQSGGTTIVISVKDIPNVGRTTFGSNAMHTDIINEGNHIVSVSKKKDDDKCFLVISKMGYGKLISMDEFNTANRGTKGSMNAKLKENDQTVAVLYCQQDQELTMVTNKNIIKIPLVDINILKRPTLGVKLKDLSEGEEILDITIM